MDKETTLPLSFSSLKAFARSPLAFIDYKTNNLITKNKQTFIEQEKTKHLQQLSSYRNLLAQLYVEKIHCGLYYPVIPLWIESPL